MSIEGELTVVSAPGPFAQHPLGKPAAFKLANLRQIILPDGEMPEADNFEISAVCGMVLLATG
ncbi:hypothetical protein MES4922_190580 [Mesorhizobium ventifaucium]|uniref:Uncharacterized protein n=1 Tax=Mesorhizobium ventifaucium TaxID=666020 RepID=A0ABM9DN03_9HYPH|nr:hypothetical protein MES4922_190580 [Mesorhizobium ventifaucium]